MVDNHLSANRQIAILTGPRQVGKTTLCRQDERYYFNWDNIDHRQQILSGPQTIARICELDRPRAKAPILIFDELHKFGKWKDYLKGFFDTYEHQCRIVVTGSAKLDFFRKGGDSLMGRYFPYRLHPFSVAERIHAPSRKDSLIVEPQELDDTEWNKLLSHGGFPEPFVKGDPKFTKRWRNLRTQQFIREDLRDYSRVNELQLLETLATLLAERSGEQLVYANLAKQIQVSPQTAKSWVEILVAGYLGFLVRPYYSNINKALRKEPKWYVRDWSGIEDSGKRAETLVGCHLLKAVDYWTDNGEGSFDLRYIRDKQKREVDFLIVRDDQPWGLVEVKKADTQLSTNLAYFQEATAAKHAFQVVLDLEYEPINCFDYTRPVVVPAKTILSQLV
jgi:predicted AAA+ superfamily ATPase